MAANAVSCEVEQIGKTIIFQIAETGQVALFITAGGRMSLNLLVKNLAAVHAQLTSRRCAQQGTKLLMRMSMTQ